MGGARWWAIIGCGTLVCIAGHARADELWAVEAGRLYVVDTDALTATLIGDTGITRVGGLAFNGSGVLYGIDTDTDQLVRISTLDGSASAVGGMGFDASFSMGLGYDATTDTLFASASGAGLSSRLITIDERDGSGSLIGETMAEAIVGLDTDGSGQLWGIDGDLEHLLRIDKASGGIEVMSDGGLRDFDRIGGFEITPSGNFWAINASVGGPRYELVFIDPDTGLGTVHGDIAGFSGIGGVTGLAAIPAPGTAAVLALGSLAVLRRRREAR
jgi:hypothetical protein